LINPSRQFYFVFPVSNYQIMRETYTCLAEHLFKHFQSYSNANDSLPALDVNKPTTIRVLKRLWKWFIRITWRFSSSRAFFAKRITVTKTNTMKSLITVNVGVILIFEKCPTADRVCGCSAWNVYKFYCVTCTLNSSLTLRKITICDKNSCSWLLIKVVLSLPSKRRIETFLFSGSGSSTNSSAKFHRSGFGSRKVSWK